MDSNGKDAPTAAVVRAQAFRLVDQAGEERGSFELDTEGHPALTLRDGTGRPRVTVCLAEDGRAGVEVRGADGRTRLLLTLGEGDTPRIWLYDGGSDDPRLGLLVDAKGAAAVDLWALGSETGITVFAARDGELSLALWHADDDVPRVGFRVAVSGDGSALIRDARGGAVWRVPEPGDAR